MQYIKFQTRPEPTTIISNVCAVFGELNAPKSHNKASWTSAPTFPNSSAPASAPTNSARFQEQLRTAKLSVTDVQSDGNSQFRALAHQIYGTEDAHSVVRLLVMSEILAHPSLYERFIAIRGMETQKYVSVLAKDGSCGDHLTFCAFTNFYGVDLLIYSPMFSHPLLVQSRNPQTTPVMCISFIDDTHYQSLSSSKDKMVIDSPSSPEVKRPEEKKGPTCAARRWFENLQELFNKKTLKKEAKCPRFVMQCPRCSPLSLWLKCVLLRLEIMWIFFLVWMELFLKNFSEHSAKSHSTEKSGRLSSGKTTRLFNKKLGLRRLHTNNGHFLQTRDENMWKSH